MKNLSLKKLVLWVIIWLGVTYSQLNAQCDSITFDCFNFDLVVDLAVDTTGQLNLCEGEPITFLNQTNSNLGAIDSFVWIFNYLGADQVPQECYVTPSLDPITYIYNFEDSIICTNPNQDFILLSVGLSAIDTAGCFSLVQSNEIIINILPRALFTATPFICSGEGINITNLSCPRTANLTYEWESQPDGQTSTDFNPDFEYDTPGTYTITLTAISERCDFEDVYEQTVTVLEPPIPGLVIGNGSTDSLCAELDTLILIDQSQFTDTTYWQITPAFNVTYVNDVNWGDTVLVIFQAPGNYNLTLNSGNQGCTKDTSFNINVAAVAVLNVNNLPDCIDTNVIDLSNYTNFNGIPDNYVITVTYLEDLSTQVFNDVIPTALNLSGFGSYEVEIISHSECGELRRTGLFGYYPTITLSPVPALCENQDTLINLNDLITPENIGNICIEWVGSAVFNDSLFNPSLVGEGNYTLSLRDCDNICIDLPLQIDVLSTDLGLDNLNICVANAAMSLDDILPGQWSGVPVLNDSLHPNLSGVGIFEVYYVSDDSAYCQRRDTILVEVKPLTTVDFMVNSPNCVDSVFQFVNLSSDSVISWNFDDGFFANLENPAHQFISAGTYQVQLIAGDVEGGCIDSLTFPVVVDGPPTAVFNVVIDSTGCDSVDLTMQAVLQDLNASYQWVVNGDTLNGATVEYTNEVLDTISQITITLTVTNTCGTASASQLFNIPAGFFSDIIFDSEAIKCAGDTVDFILVANLVDSFIIDYGNGIIAINEVLDIPFENSTDTIINYLVTVYGYSEACGWDTGFTIVPVQKDVPFASALYSDNAVCLGEPIDFYNNSQYENVAVMYFGDGNSGIFTTDTITYSYTSAGNFIPYVIAFGCGTDTNILDPISISSLPIFSIETEPVQPCLGDQITMINSGNNISPVWLLNGDTLASFVDTLIFTPGQPGTYEIVLVATAPGNSFCSTTDTVVVSVSEGIQWDVSVFPLNGCAPLNVALEVNSSDASTNYLINFGNQQVSQNNIANTIYNSGGVYAIHIEAINDNGCTLDTIVEVTVLDEYIVEAIGDTSVLIGEAVELDFTVNQLFESFSWYVADSILGTNTVRPLIIYPTEDGVYTVEVTGIDSSCFGKDSVLIRVECDDLFLPDAFSPNNDGVNDTYSIYTVFSDYDENNGLSCIEFIDLSIFDRWGELIYLSENISDAWDGIYKGKALNAGMFTIIVNYRAQNQVNSIKKAIHLIK
jgi:gliding motility-associated-like protein